jgi:acetyl-CoA carboxylase / biotin carboxylase 1
MQAKGVIRRQVAWAQSRHFFYWRLRRRLAEFDVAKSMRETDSTIATRNDAIAIMKGWFLEANGTESVWDDDKKCMVWMQENTALLRNRLTVLKERVLARELGNQMSELLSAVSEKPAVGLETLIGQAMSQLSEADRKLFKAAVSKMA